MVPDSLWYCKTVLLGAVLSHVPARPATRQSFSYKWGAAGWGEKYMFMFDWSALIPPPPRRPPWTAWVHFRDSYRIEVSHLNVSILCQLLLLISISVGWPVPIWFFLAVQSSEMKWLRQSYMRRSVTKYVHADKSGFESFCIAQRYEAMPNYLQVSFCFC